MAELQAALYASEDDKLYITKQLRDDMNFVLSSRLGQREDSKLMVKEGTINFAVQQLHQVLKCKKRLKENH